MDDADLVAVRVVARELWLVPWVLAGMYVSAAVSEGGVRAWARNSIALRWATAAWNGAMGLLSMWMAVRLGSLVAASVAARGLAEEACDSSVERTFPMFVFTASKLIELGDTALLVVRGRPLSTLHVWHHASVMVYCWSAWGVSAPAGSLFALMNAIVHSIMYPYFALQSIPHGGVRRIKAAARSVSSAITVLQIAQMAAGLGLALATAACTPPEGILNNAGAVAMYASYLILFVRLYVTRAVAADK